MNTDMAQGITNALCFNKQFFEGTMTDSHHVL